MEKTIQEIIAKRKAQAHDTKYVGPLYLDKSSFKKGIMIANEQLKNLEKNRPKEAEEEINKMIKEVSKIMYRSGINREVNSYYLGLMTSYSYYLARGKLIKGKEE